MQADLMLHNMHVCAMRLKLGPWPPGCASWSRPSPSLPGTSLPLPQKVPRSRRPGTWKQGCTLQCIRHFSVPLRLKHVWFKNLHFSVLCAKMRQPRLHGDATEQSSFLSVPEQWLLHVSSWWLVTFQWLLVICCIASWNMPEGLAE